MMEETVVKSFKIEVEGAIKCEGMPKLDVKNLAVLVVPMVHGVGSRFRGRKVD